MNHKEGYKKRYKMYKSGKFWVVAGLLFLGNVAISDVHASAQESENTTAKAATEVMKIGDPITEKSVVKEKIDNEGG
ncbi:TPA: KxYKxGKxW signal peptide domain-containing protein, partial [Staphylococcus aureus]|nr:KxYKxGKxW signal peptide domain-containing protein [Staphylococcus aureus]